MDAYQEAESLTPGCPNLFAIAVVRSERDGWGSMRSLLAVIFTALASIASAQPMTLSGPETATSVFGPDPIIQITTTFHARIEGSADPRDVPSTTAQETARRTLYHMAANECTVLAEYWRAECRLSSFAVYVADGSAEGPGVQSLAPSMFGTAVFELKLASPGR